MAEPTIEAMIKEYDGHYLAAKRILALPDAIYERVSAGDSAKDSLTNLVILRAQGYDPQGHSRLQGAAEQLRQNVGGVALVVVEKGLQFGTPDDTMAEGTRWRHTSPYDERHQMSLLAKIAGDGAPVVDLSTLEWSIPASHYANLTVPLHVSRGDESPARELVVVDGNLPVTDYDPTFPLQPTASALVGTHYGTTETRWHRREADRRQSHLPQEVQRRTLKTALHIGYEAVMRAGGLVAEELMGSLESVPA